MMGDKHVEHNGSGYVDSTVDSVIKREIVRKNKKDEDYKYHKMYHEINKILKDYDYVLEGPISMVNINSGRKRRIY